MKGISYSYSQFHNADLAESVKFSVISKYAHLNSLHNDGKTLTYCGEGKLTQHQINAKGNAALSNSLKFGNPVRVILKYPSKLCQELKKIWELPSELLYVYLGTF